MKVVVVDDRRDVLVGRLEWLRSAGHDTVGLSFEEALNRESWADVDVAVLDGRDDRAKPLLLGDFSIPDRFLGPRVAANIRNRTGRSKPKIVLISAFARTHPELSLRCRDAGVDFIFDYFDLSTPEDFVSAVISPDGHRSPVTQSWRRLGFISRPQAEAAVRAAEASPAWREVLRLNPRGGEPSTGHERRKLREDLGRLLPIPLYGSGSRRRLAHNSELRPILRKLLGLRPDDEEQHDG